jgi:ribosome-binding factor A
MSIRTERVQGEIQHILAKLFQNEFSDLYSGLLTVTGVRISADLQICKVYLSILGSQKPKNEILNDITLAAKEIRLSLAKEIHLRHVPELHFYIDDTLDEVHRLEHLFQQIRNNDDGSDEKL